MDDGSPGQEHATISMCESGDTQLLGPVEVPFLSPFAGQLRESHVEGGGDFGALSPLLRDPSPSLKVLHPSPRCEKLRLPLRYPILDDFAEDQNIPLLCPWSYRIPKGQGTSD